MYIKYNLILKKVFGCGKKSKDSDDEDDSNESKSKHFKSAKDILENTFTKKKKKAKNKNNRIKNIDPNSYHAKRDALKAKIVKEVYIRLNSYSKSFKIHR